MIIVATSQEKLPMMFIAAADIMVIDNKLVKNRYGKVK